MPKRNYWSRKQLFDTGADYLIAFGQNASGKSYQGKLECVERALRGERFFFLKRWKEDIKQTIANNYFDDIPISKLTKGEWERITAWQGYYYFARLNDKGELEKSDVIGAYGALNEWQRYKSNVYVNYTFLLFEEFISKDVYLNDEPLTLHRLITTIFRDHKGQVLMLGNTISRTVPYFLEWTPNVIKQKQGTIEIYHMKDFSGEGNDVDIAVEYTGHIKGSNLMAFGNASKSIKAGEWSVENHPKLPKDHIDYQKVYELMIKYQQFAFVVELLVDPEEGTKLVFVYPRTTDREIERVITNEFSDKPNVSRYFKSERKSEQHIMDCIANERICFSDNLTATDFLSVIKMLDI